MNKDLKDKPSISQMSTTRYWNWDKFMNESINRSYNNDVVDDLKFRDFKFMPNLNRKTIEIMIDTNLVSKNVDDKDMYQFENRKK